MECRFCVGVYSKYWSLEEWFECPSNAKEQHMDDNVTLHLEVIPLVSQLHLVWIHEGHELGVKRLDAAGGNLDAFQNTL
jgi:hypothetical protein